MRRTIEQSAPATFFQRVGAFLLDLILSLVVIRIPVGIASLFNSDLNHPVLFAITVGDIIAWFFVTLYFVLTTYLLGGTFGKLAFRLRVMRSDGAKLGFFTVLFRETVGRYLSGFLNIGYLIALFHHKHLALHDMICDTEVRNVVKISVLETAPASAPAAPAPVSEIPAEQAAPVSEVPAEQAESVSEVPAEQAAPEPVKEEPVLPEPAEAEPEGDATVWEPEPAPEPEPEPDVTTAAPENEAITE